MTFFHLPAPRRVPEQDGTIAHQSIWTLTKKRLELPKFLFTLEILIQGFIQNNLSLPLVP